MSKIYEIDCMKYRKSTHIAGVDIETIIAEKGNCIVTIKEAWYEKGVDVSGNKTDGYFIKVSELEKPMLVNSINRKVIALLVKNSKNLSSTESRNIGNWIGFEIELYFDASVKMMGQVVGGIRVKTIAPKKSIVSDVNALSLLDSCKTLEELKVNWALIKPEEKSLPTVLAKKESLKNTLK